MDITEIMKRAAATAQEKGFRHEEKDILVDIALMHSELSEALEELRDPEVRVHEIEWEGDKPTGVAVEFADTIIRICETCEHHGIPLDDAIPFKMDYNDKRPHRHGGKRV